ncbi:RcnB family protein [Novosphingobium flavum]|nr:RcnB family protein [Novosphingobium aerophilum]
MMNRKLTRALGGLLAMSMALTAMPSGAQRRDSDRDGRPDRAEWNRDRDRDGRPDQWDRHDNRRDRGAGWNDNGRRWRYYGGNYGYRGYEGRWRTGQRYPYYRDRGHYVTDYRAYGLPAPRRGYRYYRTDNGDIVMAAVASGVIGLIIGGALAR